MDTYFYTMLFVILFDVYRETAMAILSEGFDALKWESTSTPLQLLIQEMPSEKCMLLRLFCLII